MSKLKSIKEIEAGWDGVGRPEDGQIYQHYKGGRYKIVATGFLEKSEAPCVVYQSLETNIVWVRTAKDFLESTEYNGTMRPRFNRCA